MCMRALAFLTRSAVGGLTPLPKDMDELTPFELPIEAGAH